MFSNLTMISVNLLNCLTGNILYKLDRLPMRPEFEFRNLEMSLIHTHTHASCRDGNSLTCKQRRAMRFPSCLNNFIDLTQKWSWATKVRQQVGKGGGARSKKLSIWKSKLELVSRKKTTPSFSPISSRRSRWSNSYRSMRQNLWLQVRSLVGWRIKSQFHRGQLYSTS